MDVDGSVDDSIVVTETSQGKINQVTSTPYPVDGIDLFILFEPAN